LISLKFFGDVVGSTYRSSHFNRLSSSAAKGDSQIAAGSLCIPFSATVCALFDVSIDRESLDREYYTERE
jgi:hypothetical protein